MRPGSDDTIDPAFAAFTAFTGTPRLAWFSTLKSSQRNCRLLRLDGYEVFEQAEIDFDASGTVNDAASGVAQGERTAGNNREISHLTPEVGIGIGECALAGAVRPAGFTEREVGVGDLRG